MPLIGDAKLTLRALIAEVKDRLGASTREQSPGGDAGDQDRSRTMDGAVAAETDFDTRRRCRPYRVIWDLMHTVDIANTIITHDAGSPRDQLSPFWEPTEPLTYIGWGKTTQLGYGLGLAMGAKLAAPEKLCINVWGDAAIGFTGMDFETAVRERIPILSVLLNNFSMAIELPDHAGRHREVPQHRYLRQLCRHGQGIWRLRRARHRSRARSSRPSSAASRRRRKGRPRSWSSSRRRPSTSRPSEAPGGRSPGSVVAGDGRRFANGRPRGLMKREWFEKGRIGLLPELMAQRYPAREALCFKGRRASFAELAAGVDRVAKGLIAARSRARGTRRPLDGEPSGVDRGDLRGDEDRRGARPDQHALPHRRRGLRRRPVRLVDADHRRRAPARRLPRHGAELVRRARAGAGRGCPRPPAGRGARTGPRETGHGRVGRDAGAAARSVPDTALRAARAAPSTPTTSAFLMYTSGTTGFPKGAMHGHASSAT